MFLFYDSKIEGDVHFLNEEESYHCIRVLRLKEGSIMHVTNGNGDLFETVIQQIDKKIVKLRILQISKEYQKRQSQLHIGIAPTKSTDRFEWFLEKATEIGIDEITPLICERSERSIIKPERMERVIIAAMKQSIKAYKPKLNIPVQFKNFVLQPFANFKKNIAICEGYERLLLKHAYTPGTNSLILIGPEGDFTNEETAIAIQSGFIPVSLGPSRLRTETAGVVSCSIFNLINENLAEPISNY